MVTIHNFGLNNIDLEGRVEQDPQGLDTIEIPTSFGQRTIIRTAVRLPADTVLLVEDNGKKMYGIIDTSDKNDKRVSRCEENVTLLTDEKYNLVGGLETVNPGQTDHFWHIKVMKKSGGGGAYNAAYGLQRYLSSLSNNGIEARLIVPVGSKIIKSMLPNGLDYLPVYGYDESNIGQNLNFTHSGGKKFTSRSKVKQQSGLPADLAIKSGDLVVLNTVRDVNYLGFLEKELNKDPSIKLFIAATDSMISSLEKAQKGKILYLIQRSGIYISNKEELEMVLKDKLNGQKIDSPDTLAWAMQYIQSNLRDKQGRVYVTFGEMGSAVLDRDGEIYFQPSSSMIRNPFEKRAIVNTNGCGDAYLAIVEAKEVLGCSALEILDSANAAAHICATHDTASGNWMATEDEIQKFRGDYGRPDFLRYDLVKKDFIRINGNNGLVTAITSQNNYLSNQKSTPRN